MNRDEVKQILMRIEVSYPNWKPSAPLPIVVDTWFEMLNEYTYDQVASAVKIYVLSNQSGFAPTIGEIVEILKNSYDKDDLNELSAWELVLRALRNSGYHSEEEFEKLPYIIQRTIGSANQLYEWAIKENTDGKTMSVLQSNFIRTFKTISEREKALRKIPTELLKTLAMDPKRTNISLNKSKPLPVDLERKNYEQNKIKFNEHIQEKINNAKQRLLSS